MISFILNNVITPNSSASIQPHMSVTSMSRHTTRAHGTALT